MEEVKIAMCTHFMSTLPELLTKVMERLHAWAHANTHHEVILSVSFISHRLNHE